MKKITQLKFVILGTAALVSMAALAEGNPAKGKTVYQAKCASCHEPSVQGPKIIKIAPDIKNPLFLGLVDDKFITETITKGRSGTAMTPMPMGIKNEEIADVISYLRSIPVSEPFKRKLASIKIDPARKVSGSSSDGNEKFNLYCSQCHGDKGKGIMGNGPGIGNAGFLATASDDFIFQTVLNGRPGTAMRSFRSARGLANLQDDDINDIIAYLRSLQK